MSDEESTGATQTASRSDSSRVLSRRAIVAGGLALAGGALAGPGRRLLDALPFLGPDPEPLERSNMTAHVGERFDVHTSDGSTATI